MSRIAALTALLIVAVLTSFSGLAFLYVPITAILAVFLLLLPAESFD